MTTNTLEIQDQPKLGIGHSLLRFLLTALGLGLGLAVGFIVAEQAGLLPFTC